MEIGKPFAKTCEACGKPSVFHFFKVEKRQWTKEYDFCEQHANEFYSSNFPVVDESSFTERQLNTATRFDLELMVMKNGQWDAYYFLREHSGSRHFSAKMGYCEAVSLYWNLPRSANTQLGTHSAFNRAIIALQGTVQDILIYGFTEVAKYFHAFVRIRHADKLIEVDIRPSDALNLAVICDAPIFVSEKAWQTYMTSPAGIT